MHTDTLLVSPEERDTIAASGHWDPSIKKHNKYDFFFKQNPMRHLKVYLVFDKEGSQQGFKSISEKLGFGQLSSKFTFAFSNTNNSNYQKVLILSTLYYEAIILC